jgi:toxin-antitoxin system PIN domain toxin
VIVLDANILLYAYDSASAEHTKARNWIERTFSDGTPVGLPWQTVAVFLRIMTNPKLPGERFTPEEAVHLVDQWLDQPNVRLLTPGKITGAFFARRSSRAKPKGPLITDAQLAALTIEYGGVLHTTDRDFARFPELRWVNPIA